MLYMSSFGLSFCEPACVPTAHSLHQNPPKVTVDFGAMNGQWVCVHTLTKGKPKLDIACILQNDIMKLGHENNGPKKISEKCNFFFTQ